MTALVLGIDPGPEQSAYCFVGPDYSIDTVGKTTAEGLVAMLRSCSVAAVVVEKIMPYGKAVGNEVFNTLRLEGRILQVCEDLGIPCFQYGRRQYGQKLAGEGTVNDTILRRALIERFGEAHLGPLREAKSDLRSAFALGVYHLDQTGMFPGIQRRRRAVHA